MRPAGAFVVAALVDWFDANGNLLGSGPILPINITTSTTFHTSLTGDCFGSSNIDSVTITINPSFSINTIENHTSCLGNDGSVTILPDLGNTLPPWDMELVDMSGTIIQTAANVLTNSYTFSNLFSGTYIVRVLDVAGCSNQSTFVINQLLNPISVSSSFTNVSCYQGDDAQITINAQGGLLPYRYFIDGILNPDPYPLDSLFSNLSCGTYIISVIDDND